MIWRGNDYKPIENGIFLTERESFDTADGDSAISMEADTSPDNRAGQNEYYSGDDDD